MKQTNFEWLLALKTAESDMRQREKREEFLARRETSSYQDTRDFLAWLASPHIEPIILNVAERKAAVLAVAIGLPWIRKTQLITYISELDKMSPVYPICDIPNIKPLCELFVSDNNSKPIDLRTLL